MDGEERDKLAQTTFGCDPDEIPEGFVGFGHVHIPRANLLDRIFGNCDKGIHKFENFLVSESMPSIGEMRGRINAEIFNSLKDRDYEIRCVRCGRKAQ